MKPKLKGEKEGRKEGWIIFQLGTEFETPIQIGLGQGYQPQPIPQIYADKIQNKTSHSCALKTPPPKYYSIICCLTKLPDLSLACLLDKRTNSVIVAFSWEFCNLKSQPSRKGKVRRCCVRRSACIVVKQLSLFSSLTS